MIPSIANFHLYGAEIDAGFLIVCCPDGYRLLLHHELLAQLTFAYL